MNKIPYYINSMRLRTLPLSLAGVCLGIMLAIADYKVNVWACVFIILTTICLQVLSNVSNELGDNLAGTDTDKRQGPQYSMGEGKLDKKDMKRMIFAFVGLSIVCGLLMIYFSFGTLLNIEAICLMMLGAAAIKAAMSYTLGKNPYGYRGLGDIYVFLFFGIVSVLGSYFVASHAFPTWIMALPAVAIGAFSVAVLNVNNIRDMRTDEATRVTVALKLGLRNARIYQTCLIAAGWACMICFCLLRFFDPWHYLFVITLPLFILHLKGVWTRTDKDLDPMLPMLVMGTFALALLCGFGFDLFLIVR